MYSKDKRAIGYAMGTDPKYIFVHMLLLLTGSIYMKPMLKIKKMTASGIIFFSGMLLFIVFLRKK